MKNLKRIALMTFLFGLLISLTSCPPKGTVEDINPITETITTTLGKIVIGATTEAVNTTITTSGGLVKVTKSDSPINGLEILVPAGAFATSLNFSVSSAEIKQNSLGSNFNPISPLITITYNGGYANEMMELKIPIKLPAGQIAIGFYYDAATGKLEAIPVNAISSTSITLLTRHFLPASSLKSGNIGYKAGTTSANVIISSIPESLLSSLPMITSGFVPGIDDWEFVNDGSYISIGGHCAGQNLAAMWYYYEKKPSEGQLFGKYCDNPKLWLTNPKGYRLCSVLQCDFEGSSGEVMTFFSKYIDKNQELDRQKLFTIAGAMLITGEPQGVGIYRKTGLKADGTPKYGGHDLICYKVAVLGGKLYISDPNTPGKEQSIDFDGAHFKPYNAKLNGKEPSTREYPFITYYAKTSELDWPQIGKRWKEMTDNKIGNVAPNTFPSYKIMSLNNGGFELQDGSTISSDTLKVMVECPGVISGYNRNGKRYTDFSMIDVNGKTISATTDKIDYYYTKLSPGLNKVGFYIWSLIDNSDEFIDFKWININYVPAPQSGLISRLQRCRFATIYLSADITLNNGIKIFDPWPLSSVTPSGTTASFPLTWNGNSFSVSYDFKGTGDFGIRSGTIAGTIAADGSAVATITAKQIIQNFYTDGSNSKRTVNFSAINVPYFGTSNINEEGFQNKGTSTSKCVTNFTLQDDYYNFTYAMPSNL